jgi:hypothetical protein
MTFAIVLLLANALFFTLGGLVGEQAERSWWDRNLPEEAKRSPGIRRRLGTRAERE